MTRFPTEAQLSGDEQELYELCRSNPQLLLDALIAWLGVENDEELARVLNIRHFIIVMLRHNKLAMNDTVLMLILSAANIHYSDLSLILAGCRRRAGLSGAG